ncbi:MAG: VWA domain-containing protein [Planctomycetota bacterium]
MTVIYLLDQSSSIPIEHRHAMVDYVDEAIKTHREGEDHVGVIVFGRDAAIEIPPFDDDVLVSRVESTFDPDYTDLARAMRLAQASFPEDSSRRVVIVSDGNENLGDAVEEARGMTNDGVGIDVVPIRYPKRGEVVVERVTVPANVREGQTFKLKVVVANTKEPTEDDPGVVRGRLVVKRRVDGREDVISEGQIELPPGKWPYEVQQEIEAAGFFEFEAVFIPDREIDDTMPQNNRATDFAQIRGKGKILVIEDHDTPGEFERLVRALKRQSLEDEELQGEKLEVTVMPSNRLFTRLIELQQYDAVILANVPRERFTDEQIRMLVRNTHKMGSGLIMLGGPNSFGAGGWHNTELEEAMPVDFQVKSAKVVPRGALAMVMHASEMARGNRWQKKIAEEALKVLGARDYCGVIHYDNAFGCKWLWSPGLSPVGGNRAKMMGLIGNMTPGDMPHFDPGMRLALKGFTQLDNHPDPGARPAVKHMIVISDGDPTAPLPAVVQALANSKISVSTVAVACHGPADTKRLFDLATKTGGRPYNVKNAKLLPRIFQQEARKAAQPLIYENTSGVKPQVLFGHEMISGIGTSLPPITGFVMTTRKEHGLVEVALVSPQPGPERNRTLLASWTYGLGKAVAFTTDAGARWANAWTGWENYDKLFGQIVIWAMRPPVEEGKFTVATEVRDGQVRVVVNALDQNDEHLNFLNMAGSVIRPGPDLETAELSMEQTAPGRYVGTFPARDAGSYFIMVNPGTGQPPIRAGVNVPYSDEFRARATNEALLGRLADFVPEGGVVGRLIEGPERFADLEPYLAVNTFRHDLAKAESSQPVWYYLVLIAGCLFFFDVFVRRVHVSFAWVPRVSGRIRDRIFGRPMEPERAEVIDRLKSSKAEVDDRLEQLRAAAKFEALPEAGEIDPDATVRPDAAAPARPTAPRPQEAAGQEGEESYTERLLRAKKKAWKDQKGRGTIDEN